MKLGFAVLLLALHLPLGSASSPHWTLCRSLHFEVYSQTGDRDGQSTLLWLERLRAFFLQAGITNAGADLENKGPVRVILFKSTQDYAPFRPAAAADAFFLSGEARNYLVLPAPGSQEFATVAHEYGHLVMHSMGVHLPVWLAEGIAEFFSTVRITERECFIGGDLPGRVHTLRQSAVDSAGETCSLPLRLCALIETKPISSTPRVGR